VSTPDLPLPNKRLGQNFLIDPNIVRKIVALAELGPNVHVLEIGPGRGILTEALCHAAGRVTAVEVDPPRVWLQGARGDVLRLSEVVTETIDVTGLDQPAEREVKLSLGAGRVWKEESGPVKVKLQVDPVPPPAPEPPAETKRR